ncbi:MAG: UDP-N-acetylglucosamine 1-carboxyvinyltransferase [Patescibacteria group bacterium]|nr:MAG: UDP-N-acetylglucosamine 1-carboxyvinyltransferase [Patescibacteria group bacterium]
MEDSYIIKGGKKIQGDVYLSGAKNVALKMIIASLLFEEKVILDNIPQINDVKELIHLVNQLGAKTIFIEKNKLEVDPRGLKLNKVDFLHASKIRVSFMLFAPLLYKFGSCYIPNPGGCRIGARPIDRIVEGMKSLGVDVVYNSETGYYYAKLTKKPSGIYKFSKQTHTGTELLIMLSIFSDSEVILENCALEPEIDDLINFLNQSGAKIEKNERTIKIVGVKKLKFNQPYSIITDRNEAVTFVCLGLGTGGWINLKNINPFYLDYFINKLKQIGVSVEKNSQGLLFKSEKKLTATNIETMPHPGFMTDWQPNWAVLMTQAEGISTITERVFENRFSYVEELKKLGAKINFIEFTPSNPFDYYYFNYEERKKYSQKIEIIGPTKLHGGVLNIVDLRAGASLAIAALIANGESIINQVSILERGYENFIEKVKKIGGEIKKV